MPARRKTSIRVDMLDEFNHDDQERQAFLDITCDGGQGQITCRATVNFHTPPSQAGFSSESHLLFSDYSKTLETLKARATQKNIDTLYAKYTTGTVKAGLMAAAIAHYTTDKA